LSEDNELERLKAERLAEMQKNLSLQKEQQKQDEISEDKKKKTPSPREILVSKLGYRGLEVLQNAESQFPNQTKFVVQKLVELIMTGELNEELDGGKLLLLFRAVGVNIRMQTKINIEQDGKFVSLSEKFSKSTTDESENDSS